MDERRQHLRFDHRALWLVAGMLPFLFVSILGCFETGEDPCGDIDCIGNERCVDGACVVPGSECEPECDEGEICSAGRCISASGGCDHQGQPCAVSEIGSWDGDYICVDWRTRTGEEAVCSRDCRTEMCPDGSDCFAAGTGAGFCNGDDDCGERELCFQGQCVMALCRSSECEITDGSEADCPAGERCGRIGDEIDLCVPEGSQQPGQDCIDIESALETEQFTDTCTADSLCVGGICRPFCDDGECVGEEQCMLQSMGDGARTVGVCGPVCDIDDPDSCADDETCVPRRDGTGVCEPAGTVDINGRCGSTFGRCERGAICAERLGDDAYGRCVPVCDLSVAGGPDGAVDSQVQAEWDATCPSAESETGMWAVWQLAETGEPMEFYIDAQTEPAATVDSGDLVEFDDATTHREDETGWIEWALRPVGAASTDVPVAEGQFELTGGQRGLLALTPVPGESSQIEGQFVDLGSEPGVHWIHAIPDAGAVDLWRIPYGAEEPERLIESLEFGAAAIAESPEGLAEFRAVEAGGNRGTDALAVFEEFEWEDSIQLAALRGTLESGDAHSPDLSETDEQVPRAAAGVAAILSCRPVNDGEIGGCIQACRDDVDFDEGICRGDAMGCGPHFYPQAGQWSTICQPVGTRTHGDGCDPMADNPCAEGLYCEEFGEEAGSGGRSGLCSHYCRVGSEERCEEGRGCSPVAGPSYELGECRTVCELEKGYEESDCPPGQNRCRPEARIAPSGDGVGADYDITERASFCRVSGTAAHGESCFPGDCVGDAECLGPRSTEQGLTESILSPYVNISSLSCRPICDPFTDEQSYHSCGTDETCLFNFPISADVGHCTEIVEQRSIGEPCENPGRACGTDAICVGDGMQAECMRFCQFAGPGDDGYARSTCPAGYSCHPFVEDVGICD